MGSFTPHRIILAVNISYKLISPCHNHQDERGGTTLSGTPYDVFLSDRLGEVARFKAYTRVVWSLYLTLLTTGVQVHLVG